MAVPYSTDFSSGLCSDCKGALNDWSLYLHICYTGKLQQDSNEVQLLQTCKCPTYLLWVGIKGEAAFIQLQIQLSKRKP